MPSQLPLEEKVMNSVLSLEQLGLGALLHVIVG
jgi:hypothetical protein